MIVITITCTSCSVQNADNFLDEIVFSVIDEDNPFAQQITSFELFMNSKLYMGKLTDTINEIKATLDSLNLVGIIVAILTNGAAWLAAIIVYLAAILYLALFDLCWMVALAIIFAALALVYLLDGFFGFFYALFV